MPRAHRITKRSVFVLLLTAVSSAFAVCETTWDGDKLGASFADRSASAPVKLVISQSNQTFLFNWGQFRVFTDAVARINAESRLDPKLRFCSDKEPNAFAAPTADGNVVGITLGMVKFANGDPDLAAFVVGHEMAHHKLGHVQSKLARNTAFEIASVIVGAIVGKKLGDKGYSPQIAYDLANIGTQLVAAKFNRDQEREADASGFQYMIAAGFNPRGAQRATRKFIEEKLSGTGTFFDTHPSWDERSANIEQLIAQSSLAQKIAANGDYSPQPSGTSTGPVEVAANALSLERLNLVAQAEVMVTGQLAQGRNDSPELRNNIQEELLRRAVLRQEAIRLGLDKTQEVQAQMDLARQGVLIGAYLNDYVRSHPVTDDQIKKEYDDIKAKLGNKEYKARHVLVATEDEAKAIIAKLKNGEKIEGLAKDSKDPGSKDRGGDLGWANSASFVPPFSAAMVKLEKGKFTEAPVKTDFGWHVIQLEDTRELNLPTLEAAKGQITQQLMQRAVQKHIDELRAKAVIQPFPYAPGTTAEIIATVNGKSISVGKANLLLSDQTRQGQADTAELRNKVREELVRREAIKQAAIDKGFDNNQVVKTQMDMAADGVLVLTDLAEYRRTHPGKDKTREEEMVQEHISELRARFTVE